MAYHIQIISSEYVLSTADMTDVLGFDLSDGKPNPPAKMVRMVAYTYYDDRWFQAVTLPLSMITLERLDQPDTEVVQAIQETLEAGDQEAAAELADEARG